MCVSAKCIVEGGYKCTHRKCASLATRVVKGNENKHARTEIQLSSLINELEVDPVVVVIVVVVVVVGMGVAVGLESATQLCLGML